MSTESCQIFRGRAMYRRRGVTGESLISLRLALLVLWPLFALSGMPNAEPERPYLVIAGTTSSNGRYAIAWTLTKGPQIDWEKFRAGERGSDYLPNFEKPANEIADNLVELDSGRKLAAVASGYWALPEGLSGPKFHPDDEFLEVAWSAQNDFVLVLHRLRSGSAWGSLRAVRIADGAVSGQLENGAELEAAVRAHLKKIYPREYAQHKDHLGLRFDDVKSLGGPRFSLNAVAALTNENGNRSYKGSTIKFELRSGKNGKLILHVLGFTEMDLDEAS